MNVKLFLLTIPAVLLLLPFTGLAGDKIVESVSPAALLKALPAVPVDWKCVQSKASTELSVMSVPITTAVRRYELPIEIPAQQDPAVPAPPPPTLRIIAMDLGSRKEDPLLREADAQADKKACRIPGLAGVVSSFPGRFIYEGIGKKRLLVQVEGRNMDAIKFRRILEGLEFSPLVAAENQFPEKSVPTEKQSVPREGAEVSVQVYKITNVLLDELNPSLNRTWESSSMEN